MRRDMCCSSGKLLVDLCLILSFCRTCKASDGGEKCSSWCGDVNVSSPFRLMDSPEGCGDYRYELSCEQNQTLLYLKAGRYDVLCINYENYTIRVRDSDVLESGHRKISLPAYFSTELDLSYSNLDNPFTTTILTHFGSGLFGFELKQLAKNMIFVRCRNPVHSPRFVDTAPCFNTSNASVASSSSYLYMNVGSETLRDLELDDGCGVELMYMTSWPAWKNNQFDWSCTDIHNMLLYGFELSWLRALCNSVYGDFAYLNQTKHPDCLVYDIMNKKLPDDLAQILSVARVVIFSTAFAIPILMLLVCHCACKCVVGPPFIIGLLIYKWRRRHLSMYENIEDFLQSENNSIMPIRYSCREIIKMTQGFKTEIGKGGYGSVFKGQLRSGHDVAVKMLDMVKGNGQDFISEVATLGRIHHVNVVQLIGYCVEGPKHALVYEFMENGSLDKYIFSKPNGIEQSLSLHQLYAISLGVARGINYLHKGCNMQILHFDIKPHNILLDDNFIPKVSDFGLAKLYPTNNRTVSLTAVRGTIGYIAPELFYRNMGGISYKADVYSFGMLLMEIDGRRKNLNESAEHSSQFYFPFWVYDQLNEGNEINIEDATEEEMKVARKMMIIGLWCIQTRPSDRPSMNKVVEMLEGDEQDLELPRQKPSFYSQDLPEADDNNHSSSMVTSSELRECSSMDEIVEMTKIKEEASKLSQESSPYALNLPTKSFKFNE
ncbi:hypothetical protein QN277_003351 [Acacia crassicarpa]|uniref:Protein kinase domain-containing protein n=1 Tax=Acacia crassicarpa TaxID=499986 RepID=A0AAE1IYC2_9FABA|nr:hypothetical protein QN277_003351 [Acacia crassicarpa]